MSKYYLHALKHNNRRDFCFLFWGKNRSGYYYDLKDAGLYDESEVDQEYMDRTSDTIAVPQEVIDPLREKYVIDGLRLGNIVRNTKANRMKVGFKLCDMTDEGNVLDSRRFKSPEEYQRFHKNTVRLLREIAWETRKTCGNCDAAISDCDGCVDNSHWKKKIEKITGEK